MSRSRGQRSSRGPRSRSVAFQEQRKEALPRGTAADWQYKKVQGCSLKADVLLPKIRRPPVLLCVHGGALIGGNRKYLGGYQADLYRRAGLAVVSIDYRLAPETLLPDIVDDIRGALAWVRGEGARSFHWAADRLVVTGGSAGGYLSLMTGTFASKPSAIVSFYGYGGILGGWYTKPSEY